MSPIISGGGGGGGGSGTVTSVASGDTSIVVTNPTTTPSLQLAALNTIATNELATGDVTVNSHKITSLANGSAATDAAAFGQIPTLLSPTAVKTANYNAAVGDLVPCDVTGGSFTVTLPTAPADKAQVCVEIVAQTTTGAPKLLTVAAGGADVFYIAAGATSVFMGQPFRSIVFQYKATGAIWYAPGTGGTLPSGFEFGYDQITSIVTVSSTSEAAGTTVIAAAAHSFDGAPVKAEFYSASILNGASGQTIVNLWEGAPPGTTNLGLIVNTQSGDAGAVSAAMMGELRFTPSAGSHTYSVIAWRAGSNGTINAGVGGATTHVPAYIRFTKV
jgi:hypothetical protein